MFVQSAIGRYLERDSVIHGMDGRAKSVCLLLLVVTSLLVNTLWALALVVVLLFIAIRLSSLSFKIALGSPKLLLTFLALALAFNFVFWQPSSPSGLFVVPHPQLAGLVRGAWIGARLILMVSFVNLFLLCTAPEECTEAVAFFLSPLGRVIRGIRSVPLVVMIALGFVPSVLAEGNRIVMAQRARGMRREKRLAGRIRELRPVIVPLFRSVILRADQLSTALEVRCFDPSVQRKSAFSGSFGARDVAALLCSAFVLGAVAMLR